MDTDISMNTGDYRSQPTSYNVFLCINYDLNSDLEPCEPFSSDGHSYQETMWITANTMAEAHHEGERQGQHYLGTTLTNKYNGERVGFVKTVDVLTALCGDRLVTVPVRPSPFNGMKTKLTIERFDA